VRVPARPGPDLERNATMSAAAVNLLRVVLGSIEAVTVKGVVLFVLAAVAGYGFYSAMAPDSALNSASADAVTIPPLVRAEPLSSPPASMRVIRETAGGPVAVPSRSPDRASLVRELQTAMTRTGCYHGPINGVWTASSKQAMSAFLIAVNAQLPVDNPDQTLLALAQSNAAAKCAPEQAIDTDATRPSTPASGDGSRLSAEAPPSEATPNSVERVPSNDRPMIERTWAPAEMLVPPKPVAQPSDASVPLTVGSVEPVLQSDASPSTGAQVIPVASGETKAQLAPASQVSPAPKVARRAKSRRHKTSDYDDVSRSISKGLNSIQRSLSSVFD
jgi:hypothetical protein